MGCIHSKSPPMTTLAASVQLSMPLEMSDQPFDMITELLGAGVPHIVEEILQSLDEKSLAMSEQVSRIWRDVIRDLQVWKYVVNRKITSNHLWRNLFKRRGWHKYLNMPPAEQISRQFYRQLHHSASRDIHTLEANWGRGHYTLTRVETGNQVLCLDCDDRKIVTGHKNSMIKVWDRSTLQLLKLLEGHESAVKCLQFQEEVVISGSDDHTVKVWDIQTGQVVNDLHHHNNVVKAVKGEVRSLKFTTDTLVTGSTDGTVAVCSMKSPTDIALRMTLKGHELFVFAVDLNETTIISGSSDKTIKVWDKFTGELVRTLRGHDDWVRCLQLQESHIISGSFDKTVRIWNIGTGECVQVLRGHANAVMCVAVDNKRILSGIFRTIKVWDLAAALNAGSFNDSLCITTLECISRVNAVHCDNFQVVSGSDNGTLVIHDFLGPTSLILRTKNSLSRCIHFFKPHACTL